MFRPFDNHDVSILVLLLSGGVSIGAYLLIHFWPRRKDYAAIQKWSDETQKELPVRIGRVSVEQNLNTGSIIIRNKQGDMLARMTIEESRNLAAYIARMTKYKHCSHTNCLEPEVPGIGYCRFHREDIYLEGVSPAPLFIPEDTRWPVDGKYERIPPDVQGLQVNPVSHETEDIRARILALGGKDG